MKTTLHHSGEREAFGDERGATSTRVVLAAAATSLLALLLWVALGVTGPATEAGAVHERSAARLQVDGAQESHGAQDLEAVLSPAGVAPRVVAELTAPPAEARAVEAAETARLTVRVTRGAGGPPLVGETVPVKRLGERKLVAHARGRTDAAGCVAFGALEPGMYAVAPVRGSDRYINLASGAHATEEFAVDPGVTVTGVVDDAADSPIANAEILLTGGPDGEFAAQAATADSAGRFTVTDLRMGHQLSARASGFAASDQAFIKGEPGEQIDVVLRLVHQAVRLEGTVLDPEGEPAVGATVRIAEATGTSGSVLSRPGSTPEPPHLVTDEEGRFSTDAAPEGRIALWVELEPYARHEEMLDVGPNGAPARLVRLELAATVNGSVRDATGQPVIGAAVLCGEGRDRRLARVERFGDYSLDGLSAGSVSLVAEHPELGRATVELELTPGETATWNPVLEPTPAIHGWVTHERGRGAAGLSLTVKGDAPGKFGFAETAADGSFRISHLEPGPYQLTVTRESGRSEFPLLTKADVQPSKDPLVLRLGERSGGQVTATLVGPDGAPVAGGSLQVSSYELAVSGEGDADPANGRVTINAIPGGTIHVRASAKGVGTKNFGPYTLDEGGVLELGELRFSATGTLIATLRGVTADEAAQCKLSVVPLNAQASGQVLTLDGLVFRADALAEGEWSLMVYGRRIIRQSVPFTITAGQATNLDLPLEIGGERVVEVRDERPGDGYLMVSLVDSKGVVVWVDGHFQRGEKGVATFYPCAAPGAYSFICRGVGRQLLADQRVTIGTNADPTPVELVVR